MKSYPSYLLPALALAAFALPVRAEQEVVIRRTVDKDAPRRIIIHKGADKLEMEMVTYLGVETAPMNRALGAQLGLPRGTGLIVMSVMGKSPAAGGLQENDVLTRLDDQLLINQEQLGVLVRSKAEGDEVRLTLIRGGKEMAVKVKLGTREMPKQANAFFFHGGSQGGPNWNLPPGLEGDEDLARLRELPGMGPDGAQDVLRMIERERRNFLTGPGRHIVARGGQGSTVVDLTKSNISYSDDEGSLEIKADAGNRNLTVKDAKGAVLFAGPINTDEERKKLPAAITKRLEKLENDPISFEVGEGFKPDVVPLPPPAPKTKISRDLGSAPDAPTGPATSPF